MVFIDEYTFMSMGQFPLFMVSQTVLLLFIMVGSVVVTISVVNSCLNNYIMVDIFVVQGILREKFMLNNIVMGRLLMLLN